MNDIEINVLEDTATPMLRNLTRLASYPEVREGMADACAALTRDHLDALPPNRQFPERSTGFYRKAEVTTEQSEGGFSVLVDHKDKPGAMRQRFYGGDIFAKDRLLTIPARAEFYGRRAGEFDNLRFVMFGKGGAKALVVGKGGVELVNWHATGSGPRRLKGAGRRERGMVAYWLVDHVFQEGDVGVIPTIDEYKNACTLELLHQFERFKERVHSGE